VILPAKKSVFWRYQRGKPDTHLATIEAIYYAVVELYKCRGNDYQDGRYDDLLFFFKYFYRQMNKMYFES
jgi:DTW domain